MELSLQMKLKQNPKFYEYLKENSWYFKELNRNADNYSKFESDMKKLYKIRTTDKIHDVMDNIDLFSSIIGALK
ncbi:MAG: hypothetical protein IJ574_00655 [Bacilli bacterium]|nr:hypothetical protein [Bacilli bacterium]